MGYSYSKINAFKQCKRKYKYLYIDKAETEQTEQQKRGLNIHSSLYKENTEIEEVQKAFKLIDKPDSKTSIGILTDKYKGGILKSIIYIHDLAILEFKEREFALNKDFKICSYEDKDYYFRGKIDYTKIFFDGTKIMLPNFSPYDCVKYAEIYDYKTGNSNGNRYQLELYSLYLYYMYGITDIRGYFVYIDKDKLSRPIILFDFEKIKKQLIRDIEKIENEKDFEMCQSPLCSYCQFNDICNGNKELKTISLEGIKNFLKE